MRGCEDAMAFASSPLRIQTGNGLPKSCTGLPLRDRRTSLAGALPGQERLDLRQVAFRPQPREDRPGLLEESMSAFDVAAGAQRQRIQYLRARRLVGVVGQQLQATLEGRQR